MKNRTVKCIGCGTTFFSRVAPLHGHHHAWLSGRFLCNECWSDGARVPPDVLKAAGYRAAMEERKQLCPRN